MQYVQQLLISFFVAIEMEILIGHFLLSVDCCVSFFIVANQIRLLVGWLVHCVVLRGVASHDLTSGTEHNFVRILTHSALP